MACLLLSACIPVARPIVKIGLVAPFEGRYRDVGYEVIYAVRLAVREANAAGGVAGYTIELMAFDDGADPAMAAEQARKMAVDPQVMGVVGHWLDATTTAAAPIYAEAGIAFLATTSGELPAQAWRLWLTDDDLEASAQAQGADLCRLPCDSLEDLSWLDGERQLKPDKAVIGPPMWGQPQFAALAGPSAEGVLVIMPAPLPDASAHAGFIGAYRAISNGVEPRFNAVLAYDAARLLLQAIGEAAGHGRPTRAGVDAALAKAAFDGLSGAINFDSQRDWQEPQAWIYQWQAGELVPGGG